MKTLIGMGLALCSLAASANAALAEAKCGPRDRIIEVLGQRYKESRQAIGLVSGQKSIVELFVSDQGTWTLSVTNTDGVSCIVSTGDNWRDVPKQLAGLNS